MWKAGCWGWREYQETPWGKQTMGTARSRLIAPKLIQKYFSLTLLSSGKGQVTVLELNQVLKVWVEFCTLVFMFFHSMKSPRKINKYQIIEQLNQTGYLLVERWKVWSRQALQRGFHNQQSYFSPAAAGKWHRTEWWASGKPCPVQDVNDANLIRIYCSCIGVLKVSQCTSVKIFWNSLSLFLLLELC